MAFDEKVALLNKNFGLWVEFVLIPIMRVSWGFPMLPQWTDKYRMPFVCGEK